MIEILPIESVQRMIEDSGAGRYAHVIISEECHSDYYISSKILIGKGKNIRQLLPGRFQLKEGVQRHRPGACHLPENDKASQRDLDLFGP